VVGLSVVVMVMIGGVLLGSFLCCVVNVCVLLCLSLFWVVSEVVSGGFPSVTANLEVMGIFLCGRVVCRVVGRGSMGLMLQFTYVHQC